MLKSVELIQWLSPRFLPILVACFLLLAGVACSKKEAPPPPPPEVQVAEVIQKDVPIYVELVGSTLGSEDVEIRARVEGYLVSINFTGQPNRLPRRRSMLTRQPLRRLNSTSATRISLRPLMGSLVRRRRKSGAWLDGVRVLCSTPSHR